MLKVVRSGRRRSNSFSILDTPRAPDVTPNNSYLPDPLLDNIVADYNLLQVAESILLKPQPPEPTEIQDKKKVDDLIAMCKEFHLCDSTLKQIEKRMVMEINWGLGSQTNATSNIKSYITYVSDLPTGREQGRFLALDLGGTNFRVIMVELEKGSSSIKMTAAKHAVSDDLMHGPGEDLFNFMADHLLEFMLEHQLLGRSYKLGFTFSFPTRQHSINNAELAHWTKGYVCPGVEGEDVATLLEKAIERHPEMDIEVSAILNDTTGCLLACAYKHPDCAMGVIIGTGTNASYVEDVSNVELFEGNRKRNRQVVINTEWGALGNTGSLDFMRSRFDHLVDDHSKNPRKQVYEKLISGMYLGELTRWMLLEAVKTRIIFNGKFQEIFEKRNIFETRHISEIESDDAESTGSVMDVLKEIGVDTTEVTALDCRAIRYICECVSTRAAVLAAAGIAALLNKMNKRRVTIGMDGSLYKFHPHFHNRMNMKIRHLVDPSIDYTLVLSEDGSGRGAGLAAAVAHR